MIELNNISKTYKFKKSIGFFKKETAYVKAVKNISFQVNEGEKLGLIGLNGAGKSTTIKMMTGILHPTSGKIEINGFNPQKRDKSYLSQIGVSMGQKSTLFFDISPLDSFRYYKEVYKVNDQDFKEIMAEFTKILKLDEILHTPVRKLSLGQKRRCEIVASLIHKPKILFLDEPTLGLDVITQGAIMDFLDEINKKFNTTILLTTHEIKNIERFCKRIIILEQGEIIYDGDPYGFANRKNFRKIRIPMEQSKSLTIEPNRILGDRAEYIIELNQLKDLDLSRFNFTEYTIEELTLEDMICRNYGD